MKIRYLTGAALTVVLACAVQSHAETAPAPPPAPDAPAAQPGDQVCDVEATVNGVVTKYHYVIRRRDGTDMAGTEPLPPPPGAPGDGHIERREVFMYGHGDHDGPHRMHAMMDMTQLDADKDGKVTFAEFTAPMQDMFSHMDANHDGSLTADELPQPPMGGPGLHDTPPSDMPPPLPPECAG